MSTILIASGTTEATSADVTLAAGESAILFLFDAAGPDVAFTASALVQVKETVGGGYFSAGRLDNNMPATSIAGPITFRTKRLACTDAFGVGRG